MAEYNDEEVVDYQDDGNELYGDDATGGDEQHDEAGDGAEPEEFNARVQEMEEELANLTKMQQQVESEITSASDRIDENSM